MYQPSNEFFGWVKNMWQTVSLIVVGALSAIMAVKRYYVNKLKKELEGEQHLKAIDNVTNELKILVSELKDVQKKESDHIDRLATEISHLNTKIVELSHRTGDIEDKVEMLDRRTDNIQKETVIKVETIWELMQNKFKTGEYDRRQTPRLP